MNVFTHNLGDRVRHRISGFTGVITTRAEHLTGCNRYWVDPEQLHEGKPVDGHWCDEEMLETVQAHAITTPSYQRMAVAGPSLVKAGGPSGQPSSTTRQTSR